MLILDGVYVDHLDGSARFLWVRSPTSQELTQLAQTIAHRVSCFLERQDLLERDADDCMDAAVRRPGGRTTQGAVAENSYLATDAVPWGIDGSAIGALDDVKGLTNVAGAWMRRRDHLSHRGGPAGRTQGIRLNRLLLVHCRRCRSVIQRNNTSTRQAR